MKSKLIGFVTVVAVQAGLVAVAVAPQLSARFTGETYQLRAAPLDPVDPFRGAYVTLDYPDLRGDGASGFEGDGMVGLDDGERGDLFVTLGRDGDVWVATNWSRVRPTDEPYLACTDRQWLVECGIESFFLPQEKAADMEALLREGAIAEVRVDGRGHAALIDVRAP